MFMVFKCIIASCLFNVHLAQNLVYISSNIALNNKSNSSVVYSRIKRLINKKLIERFTIEINNKELGFGVKSITGINMDSKQRDTVIQELFKIKGVREVSEVTVRFDILVTMYAENLSEMYRIVSDDIGKIQGVIGSESFIEMKTQTKQMPYMLEQ